jgi:hypothetical protein
MEALVHFREVRNQLGFETRTIVRMCDRFAIPVVKSNKRHFALRRSDTTCCWRARPARRPSTATLPHKLVSHHSGPQAIGRQIDALSNGIRRCRGSMY